MYNESLLKLKNQLVIEQVQLRPTTSRVSVSWSIFDKIWTSVVGYHADQFEFTPGETLMSTSSETMTVIIFYLLVVFGGRELMKERKAYKLNGLFMAHNLILTVVSASLLALFAGQLLPTLYQHGLYDNICGASGWTDPLVTLYYLNYLVKYWELLDTVFLVLKKKPLTFLHTYHHPATALLCFTQLLGHTSVSWVPITLNLFVHVVMYWYYFKSARGIRVAWKQWITILQITQFVLDLGFVYFASWDYFASTFAPSLPHVGRCAGEPWAAAAGCTILSSYLVLFVLFYLATYKSNKSKNTKRSNIASIEPDLKQAMHGLQTTEVLDVTDTVARASDGLPPLWLVEDREQ